MNKEDRIKRTEAAKIHFTKCENCKSGPCYLNDKGKELLVAHKKAVWGHWLLPVCKVPFEVSPFRAKSHQSSEGAE